MMLRKVITVLAETHKKLVNTIQFGAKILILMQAVHCGL
jgi:hypothetical protein